MLGEGTENQPTRPSDGMLGLSEGQNGLQTQASKPYDPFAGIVFPKLCDVYDNIRQNNFLPLLALLSQKPDLDLRVLDRFGYSPIHYATTFGNLQALKLIYEKNPSSLGCLSQGWQTTLMLACTSGHQEVFHFIVSKVAKMRFDDLDHWKLSPLAYCVRANNIPAFFYLLDQGAKLSTDFRDFVNNTMPHYSTTLERKTFLRILFRFGFDFNTLGEKELHPFHKSIQNWNLHTGLELIRMAEDAPWRHVGLRLLVGDIRKSGIAPQKLALNAFPLPDYSEDALHEIQSEYIPTKIKALQTAKKLFPEIYGATTNTESEPVTVFGNESATLKGEGFLNTTCTKAWYSTSMLLSSTNYLSDNLILTPASKYLVLMLLLLLVCQVLTLHPHIRLGVAFLKVAILCSLSIGCRLPLKQRLAAIRKARQGSSLTEDEELGFNSKTRKQRNFDLSQYYISEELYKVEGCSSRTT